MNLVAQSSEQQPTDDNNNEPKFDDLGQITMPLNGFLYHLKEWENIYHAYEVSFSHLKSLNIKTTTTYEYEYLSRGLRKAHHMVVLNRLMSQG